MIVKKIALIIGMMVVCTALADGHAATVDDLLAGYQREGAGPFRAEQGERLLNQVGKESPDATGNRCADCHTTDPRQRGKHVKTGKEIEPLAPAVNSERLQDAAKVEKWFLRNCKGTLGRACTPQEKGDFLTFLLTLK
ncbi:MAG: DUF1924 domain-containing protein [Magnetococcales bacterium]|nr:DUF1924 domain-containing protein [Magnetococcales bacterium]MBF0583449.1 DUF1924 domain-containing protein [Magnetococcales bacterium]